MNQYVGIWIDHRKAVIVSVSGDGITTNTLTSGVESHPRYTEQQDSGGEKRYEERRAQQLDRYYADVIGRIAQPKAVLICGPGEAKLELKARLRQSAALSATTIEITTADKLTDPQIVTMVKAHFALTR